MFRREAEEGRNAASVVCVAEAFRVGLVGRSLRIVVFCR